MQTPALTTGVAARLNLSWITVDTTVCGRMLRTMVTTNKADHASAPLVNVFGSFTPAGPQGADLRRRPERFPQEAVGMQLQQPLAFLYVALPSRKIPGVPRIHQPYIEAVLLQYVVYRNPVHAGGLHHHRLDPALLQPFRQPVQILREALKHPYRLGSPIRSHRHVMFPASDVDSRRVAMDHIQTRTAGPDLPPQFL